MSSMADMQEVMSKIRNCSELYAVMSACTHMPFVYCDPDTYDDEIFVYFTEEDARQGITWMVEQKIPIQLAKIDKKSRLDFFTGLYPAGINAVCVNKGITKEICLQLDSLIRRPDLAKLPEGHIRIENPQLHLTSLYFAQELRKSQIPVEKMSEEMKELDEELRAHFKRGSYLVALEEGKGIPVLRKEGVSYQPLFTDNREFYKFNMEKKFSAAVVEYEKIAGMMPAEAEGIVLNPFGVNILLKIAR